MAEARAAFSVSFLGLPVQLRTPPSSAGWAPKRARPGAFQQCHGRTQSRWEEWGGSFNVWLGPCSPCFYIFVPKRFGIFFSSTTKFSVITLEAHRELQSTTAQMLRADRASLALWDPEESFWMFRPLIQPCTLQGAGQGSSLCASPQAAILPSAPGVLPQLPHRATSVVVLEMPVHCLPSCQCLAASSDPKQETVAHLGASSVRNSCRLLLWVSYLVVVPGCTPISEATVAEGNLFFSPVYLKAQLVGNSPAAVTFDQINWLFVTITNCCYLSFLRLDESLAW